MTLPSRQLLPGIWQQQRGGDNLDSVYWLYNRTGEPWLLDLAAKIHEHTANWDAGRRQLARREHRAVLPRARPVTIQQTRDPRYLSADRAQLRRP